MTTRKASVIPDIDKYLLPVIAVIFVVSIAPNAFHIWRENGDEIRAWIRGRSAKHRDVPEVGE